MPLHALTVEASEVFHHRRKFLPGHWELSTGHGWTGKVS